MKYKIGWLATMAAGFVVGSQLWRRLRKPVNQLEEPLAELDSEPAMRVLAMGSEQVSSTLQNILSSDANDKERGVYIHAMHHRSQRGNYTLGSERLNRTLEEIMADDANGPRIVEPAMEL